MSICRYVFICNSVFRFNVFQQTIYGVALHFRRWEPSSSHYDPNTQFFLPDLRGRFIRGVDDVYSNRDPDRTTRTDMQGTQIYAGVGSIQNHEVINHTHGYNNMFPQAAECCGDDVHWAVPTPQSYTQTTGAGGSETRPLNAYLYFIIKAL